MSQFVIVSLDDFWSLLQAPDRRISSPKQVFRYKHDGKIYLVLLDHAVPILAEAANGYENAPYIMLGAGTIRIKILDCLTGSLLM